MCITVIRRLHIFIGVSELLHMYFAVTEWLTVNTAVTVGLDKILTSRRNCTYGAAFHFPFLSLFLPFPPPCSLPSPAPSPAQYLGAVTDWEQRSHFLSLHYTAQHCTARHNTALHSTTLYYTAQHYTTPYIQQCTTQHKSALYSTALPTLPLTALYCTALHGSKARFIFLKWMFPLWNYSSQLHWAERENTVCGRVWSQCIVQATKRHYKLYYNVLHSLQYCGHYSVHHTAVLIHEYTVLL